MENKVQQRMHDLLVSYAENLPAKINSLQLTWQNLNEHFSTEEFKTFHREVHNLTGSAGTYGFNELSKAARELEVFLKTLLDKQDLSPESESKISMLLNKVLSCSLQSETDSFVAVPKNENKMIVILEDDDDLVKKIENEFIGLEYEVVRLQSFEALLALLEDTTPVALIVDADYLKSDARKKLLAVQQKNDVPAPLFAIASSNDMQTRLSAVRAGSAAFFNKPFDIFYLIKAMEQMSTLGGVEQFRILVIDDSVSLAEYYALTLQNAGMIVKAINDPLLAIQTIIEFKPDLLLLDVYMPSCSGIELAAVLRQDPKYMHIPIVFLSSEEDKFKQLAALNLGGDDFLTKPILPQHLIAAVKMRAKRAGILSTFIKQDSLTGLLNHSTILHHLDVELIRAERTELTVSFVMLDIDHFKKINDQFGHVTGDRVLKRLSEILLTRLRKTDYVGRYGGEEFAIILTNTSLAETKKLIEELRQQVSEMVFDENEKTFKITFSAGIAMYPHYKEASQLIEAADKALYQAKNNGRNQIAIAE